MALEITTILTVIFLLGSLNVNSYMPATQMLWAVLYGVIFIRFLSLVLKFLYLTSGKGRNSRSTWAFSRCNARSLH